MRASLRSSPPSPTIFSSPGWGLAETHLSWSTPARHTLGAAVFQMPLAGAEAGYWVVDPALLRRLNMMSAISTTPKTPQISRMIP